jgi:hypothetical protein
MSWKLSCRPICTRLHYSGDSCQICQFATHRFMSEARALVNVIGNGVATIAVARSEGELDASKMDAVLSGRVSESEQAQKALPNRTEKSGPGPEPGVEGGRRRSSRPTVARRSPSEAGVSRTVGFWRWSSTVKGPF